MFMVECENNKRDHNTLIPAIIQHVHRGTLIVTDKWKGYFHLDKHGYRHEDVNHKREFVNPLTGAHTNTELRVPGFTQRDTCEEVRGEFGQIQMRLERPFRSTCGWRSFTSPEQMQTAEDCFPRCYLFYLTGFLDDLLHLSRYQFMSYSRIPYTLTF